MQTGKILKTPRQSLDLVQLLRGIASLLVVLMHTTLNAKEKMDLPFLGEFFAFGGAGVDIFFVLSGFIITYTSQKALASPSNFFSFLKRRFVRIFPTYWIIITLFLLLQLALPSFYPSLYPFNASNLANTYLLIPDHIMVNGVSWTLSYELFFYFLFSLAFLIRQKLLLWVLSIAYVITLIVLPLTGLNAGHVNPWVGLAVFPMNLEFFMGILAAQVIPRLNARFSIPFMLLGTVTFITSAIYSNSGYSLQNPFNRVILYGIPSFFIITGIVRYELNKSIKVHNLFVSLGEASYSLYLIHLPVVVAGIKIISKLNLQSGIAKYTLLIILVAAICAGSILFFKWIEKPVIDRLNKANRYRS
jgi:peptidoglycan/LPS O-acetylase OafA/YrhL